jgi:hypothetical protein
MADSPTDPIHDVATEEVITVGCGNGTVDPGEECDDGDMDDCNACDTSCSWQRALQVDGISPGARVEVADIPCISCPFTFEVWFRLDDVSSFITLYKIPGFIDFSIGPTGYEAHWATGGSGGVVPGHPLALGSWHHYAESCYWDGDAWMKYKYFDGEWFGGGSGYYPLPTWSCDEPMLIGSEAEGSDPAITLHGVIDDLRISDEALYTTDGSPYTVDRYPGVRPDTVAMWDFNREVAGVIPDVSGNGHDAVLVDGTLVPDGCHLP